jgi:hypothetical protein
MTAILHPFRTLRDSFRQIGTAVNASREYSRANPSRLIGDQNANPATSAIPL